MEDDDEVAKAVDAPPSSEQPLLEPQQAEKPDSVSEQCGTVSGGGDSTESPVRVATNDEVAEGREELVGDDEVVGVAERDVRENEGLNAEELESEGMEQLVADESVKVEELAPVSEELEVKNEEVVAADEVAEVEELQPVTEESEVKNEELVAADEVAEVEELAPVTDQLEVKNEEVVGEEREVAVVEELPPVTDELEVKNEEVTGDERELDVDESGKVEEFSPVAEELAVKNEEVSGEEREVDVDEIVKVEELPLVTENLEIGNEEFGGEESEAVSMSAEEENEGDELVKTEEVLPVTQTVGLVETKEGETAENDDGGMVEEKQEEDNSKREEEVAVEGEAKEKDDSLVNGNESSPVAMKDEEMVEEEEETPVAEEMVEEEEETPVAEELVEEEEETPIAKELGEEEEETHTAEELVEEEDTPIVDTEMETETEAVKSGSGSGGKRKRGRNSKAAPAKAPVRKTVGEDVCFICLDGGDLVLCDRRGCPKAYHPSCVDHDEDFFKTKGRWNCGWHLCNKCGKNAYFMCYTCTFSLCKGCCKDAVVFCVRGNKGFCESCMKTVKMIENSEQNEMDQVAFDDKSSWEYLFKDYWIEQKRKLCLTSDELSQAKNPWKGSDADKQQTSIEVHDGNHDLGTDSDSSLGNLDVTDSKRKKAKRKSKSVDSDTDSSLEKNVGTSKRKGKRRTKSRTKEAHSDSEHSSGYQETKNKRGKKPRRLTKSHSKNGSAAAAANARSFPESSAEWASGELLEFVMHMKDGDKSVLTQFDVQGLLLEYIKRNKLRDPRRQSQIICDSMLQKLFGKPRVGHFEMLKLLESHFLLKEDFQADNNHGTVVDEISQLDADDNTDPLDAGRSKGRKSRKRGEERGFQSNLDDYAAIDIHNINLIYLRRNLMEALMEDSETFHDRVVGAFVRIRISGSTQKQDIYRLVQIIGTSKAAQPYRVGKRPTDVMLEILNLDKTEIIPIDTISNQDFTEDECKRLRQSIKCGLISRMTVGDVVEKARELQEIRVTDWLEAEITRLSHLRDRASEKGRKKELRECVEKLQILNTREERQRRLEEIPEVHADPKMDPSCESEEESEMDNKRQVSNMRPRESGFARRGRENFSSRKGGTSSNDSWSANARPPSKGWELNRNLSGKGSSRREDIGLASPTTEHTWNNGVEKGTPLSNSWEKPRLASDPSSTRPVYSGVRSDMSTVTASESSQPLSAGVAQSDGKVSEAEKMWSYRDPTGKVQGPFSMTQLRKWSNTGYFPADLKIWKTSLSEDDSFLLTEALAGKFQKELPSAGLQSDIVTKFANAPSSIDTSKVSGNVRGSEYGGRYDSSNLPSPTPSRSSAGWVGKQTSESKWSNTSSPFRSTNQFQGSSERLPSPTPTSPSSDPSKLGRSNFSRQSNDGGLVANKEENVTASVGVVQPAFVANNIAQGLTTSVPRPDVSVISGTMNGQQLSQLAAHMANQAFASPDAGLSQTNLVHDVKSANQSFPNVAQPGTGQNPSVYTQNWAAAGYVARPEAVNPNMMSSNPNTVPQQLPYGQWTGAPVNNQASSYSSGYPPGPGNVAPNMPAMPTHNAWRPAPTNMPWGGQQQQPLNPNMGWAGPPTAPAFGPAGTVPAAMGQQQLVGPTQGASAIPPGNATMSWPNSSAGTANPGWVAPQGNTGAWAGDQNRNGGGGQWNRQSSFGSGGGAAPSGPGTPRGGGHRGVCKFHENGHCRKGSSCDFMHT